MSVRAMCSDATICMQVVNNMQPPRESTAKSYYFDGWSTGKASFTLLCLRKPLCLLVSYRTLASRDRGDAPERSGVAILSQQTPDIGKKSPPSLELRLKVFTKVEKAFIAIFDHPQQDASSVTPTSDDVGQ